MKKGKKVLLGYLTPYHSRIGETFARAKFTAHPLPLQYAKRLAGGE